MEETRPTTTTSKPRRTRASKEQEVRGVIEQLREAVHARDVDGILEFYDENARLFDVRDTLEHKDLASFRAYWDECFRSTPSFTYDLHDVRIDISGDMAVCTMLNNAHVGASDGEKLEPWMRVTAILRRTGDTWKIVHEHVSCPGDFIHGKVLDQLKPGEEVNQDQHKH